MTMPKPKQKAPSLSLPLAGGGTFTLNDPAPSGLSMVVFYRGLHCPVCKTYLNGLQDTLAEFKEKGVDVVAVTTETEERASKAKQDWGLDKLPIAYGLSIDAARDWGLLITKGNPPDQPELFAEPGLHMVAPDGTLAYIAINSAPLGRPAIPEMARLAGRFVERGIGGNGAA